MTMKFLVKGICMVPMYAEATVDAETPEEALALAQAEFKRDKQSLLIPNSHDDSAAHDWQPEAVPT